MSLDQNYKTAAIIVAGGMGIRFETEIKKQYIEIAGHPILAWTISSFLCSECVDTIVLVVPVEDVEPVRNSIVNKYKLEDRIEITTGGATRQESVYNGLKTISDDTDYAAIHDGVRPLVKPELIDRTCEAAYRAGGALAALRAMESTFIGRNDLIEEYVDRDMIWLAQTPQVFRKDIILKAHEMALKESFYASDDGMIYRKYIGKVEIIEGDRFNIKITFPQDLIFAESILIEREIGL